MFFLNIFLETVYSKTDEISVLKVPEIQLFFTAQPWWADFYRVFVIFFSRVLPFASAISIRFLKKKAKIVYPSPSIDTVTGSHNNSDK